MSPPQSIQDVDEFVSPSDLEKCVITSLALQWMGAVRMRVNGCSAVNGCRQNESQRMLCSEWVPSEWESMDAQQVNGCRQNESQWMLCSEWVPSEWESKDALQWMGAVRMRVNGCSAVNGCRQNESQRMLCSEWVPSEWELIKCRTKMLTDGLEWCGLSWCFYHMLGLSFWRHPFTVYCHFSQSSCWICLESFTFGNNWSN